MQISKQTKKDYYTLTAMLAVLLFEPVLAESFLYPEALVNQRFDHPIIYMCYTMLTLNYFNFYKNIVFSKVTPTQNMQGVTEEESNPKEEKANAQVTTHVRNSLYTKALYLIGFFAIIGAFAPFILVNLDKVTPPYLSLLRFYPIIVLTLIMLILFFMVSRAKTKVEEK